MRTQRHTHAVISFLVTLSMILTSVTPALAAPAPALPDAAVTTAPAPQAADAGLYRTTVRLAGPSDRQRFARLGLVQLDAGADWATVLVDSTQLETLARLGFTPQNTEAARTLVETARAQTPWLAASMAPLLELAAAQQAEVNAASADAVNALHAGMAALPGEARAALADTPSLDDDGDGLTNLEETWWCTDPLNPNSDGDAQGYTDGQEVAALLDVTQSRQLRWGYGPPFGPPAAWPDFNNRDGNPNTPACNDGDFDTIPDYAEAYVVGTRVPYETSDNDKFDDGQELFGITFCPGAPTNCGYGSYPAIEYWNFIKASMPNWVLPPGDSPFVAAFPSPEVHVEANSWRIERVTTITTSEGQMAQQSHSYETAVMRGQGTGIADTVTWNEWEEVSQAVETPLAYAAYAMAPDVGAEVTGSWWKTTTGSALVVGGGIGTAALSSGVIAGAVGLGACVATVVCGVALAGGAALAIGVGGVLLAQGMEPDTPKDPIQNIQHINNYDQRDYSSGFYDYSTNYSQANLILNTNQFNSQGIINSLDGLQYAINQQGQLIANGLQDIAYAIDRPRYTETRTNGHSWGGSQTTTHEVYEEHTISEGEQFTTGQNWETAWAVDSSHAADLTFDYSIRNTGTEYARRLSGLVFNIYLGDDKLPTISYPAWEQFPNGELENLFPVGPNTPAGVGSSRSFSSNPIPISLETMKRIDLGERLVIKVENFNFGADETFYTDAVNGGVTVFIEDGIEDGDESVDTYVIPTWGSESVQDVLARYFPAGYDDSDRLNALWTPEFDGINPPQWHEHYLSDIAWWNVYLTQPNAGNAALHELPAQAGAGILFRFNRDSDRDGYNDRAEFRYYCALPSSHIDASHCADGHLRPEVHPQPELLAGLFTSRTGNTVTGLLTFENTGTFDAYGIDAVMISPDDTTTIDNNTVGGNGRVRPGRHVIVGSIVQTPDMANWGASTAKPYAAGEFNGLTDLTYTFTTETPGVIGQGTTALRWEDGVGGSGVLALGDGYHAPLPVDVDRGVQIGLNTGRIEAGTSFTVRALTPRDTFGYTINSEPYTPPLIIVSYSDPQGSHRFATPVELAAIDAGLAPFSGQMQHGMAVQILTRAPFAAAGENTVDLLVNNPQPVTIAGGHLHLNFISDGKLVLERTLDSDFSAGPSLHQATWSATEFSADYQPDGDNLLIVFWTDSENNIIDSIARPFSTFQADPQPSVVVDETALTWDFGTVAQGALLRHRLSLANTGFGGLYTFVDDGGALALTNVGQRTVGAAGVADYQLTLRTADLSVGPYDATFTIKTSDPANPTRELHVFGTVTAPNATPTGPIERPLDVAVTVTGPKNQGEWVEFTHGLGPDPATLHPVKIFNDDYSVLKGVGEYATDFAGDTAAADMFGDGRDGSLTLTTSTTDDPISSVASGVSGSFALSATNPQFSPGQAIMIHQTQGTTAGTWMKNKIASYSGGIITLAEPLNATYSLGAQVLVLKQYKNVTVNEGVTWTCKPWNGSVGGIFAFLANGTVSIEGMIDCAGGNSAFTTTIGIVEGTIKGGFRGGNGKRADGGQPYFAYQGEGSLGPGVASQVANGTGGGGAYKPANTYTDGGGGGGGSHAGMGGMGTDSSTTDGAYPGHPATSTSGNTELTTMTMGGGGGGSLYHRGNDASWRTYGGSSGGGIIYIAAQTMTTTGVLSANGGGGLSVDASSHGGAGAGGSILLQLGTGALGDGRLTAVGGARNISGGYMDGGAGGVGRIRAEYCQSLTGGTNPVASVQKINCYIAQQGAVANNLFGTGADGEITISSDVVFNTSTSSLASTAVAGQSYLILSSASGLRIGDELLAVQMQGTGAGRYEYARVADVVGNQVFLLQPLAHTYTQSTSAKAQVLRVPNYRTVNITSSGRWRPPYWNGSTGGIIAFRVLDTLDIQSGGRINADGRGFRGGLGGNESPGSKADTGQTGESELGPALNGPVASSDCGGCVSPEGPANGGGGRGGRGSRGTDGASGGGGAGYANAGQQGTAEPVNPYVAGGLGGLSYGQSLLDTVYLGSGGGGGGKGKDGYGAAGGNGGGIIMISAQVANVREPLSADGAPGGVDAVGNAGGGGGGSGGSIRLQTRAAELTSSVAKSSGGAGSSGISAGGGGAGGAGSAGRIQVDYCDTFNGSAIPNAYVNIIECYIAQSGDTGTSQFALPENVATSATYNVQFGRKLDYTGAGERITVLRFPAEPASAFYLDLLLSNLSTGDVTARIDLGNDGAWDWETTTTTGANGAVALISPNLARVFNAYWATHGAPTSGNLDIPVRVSLSKAGQVLLTNLQASRAAHSLRTVQVPGATYDTFTLDLGVGSSGDTNVTVALDVGDDGTIDWTYTGQRTLPATLTTGNLATVINTLAGGQSGMVNVPVRIHVAPELPVTLDDYTAGVAGAVDLIAESVNAAATDEGTTLPVQATVRNGGSAASGPLTAAFFATLPDWGDWYIGSGFLADLGPGQSQAISIDWDTTGFRGDVPVKVVVAPYDAVLESATGNNQGQATVTVRARPDLTVRDLAFSVPEPKAGQPITIDATVRNQGVNAAGNSTTAFYHGNPDTDGAPIGTQTLAGLAGQNEATLGVPWTPTAPGLYRIFSRADRDNGVVEYDEGNNDTWRDLYVGLATPITLDSGVAGDVPYGAAHGYGVIDAGQPDVIGNCGQEPQQTFRRDPDGRVTYRFDHLLPGRFYHLNITMLECVASGRRQSVYVDDNLVAGPVDLGDGQVHKLSLRLDPALYADRAITVAVTEAGVDGALVSEIALVDVDYRYADAGGPNDLAYTPERGFGWLDGTTNTRWGPLPYQTVRIDQDDDELRYRFDNLAADAAYKLQFSFWQPSEQERIQKVFVDGVDVGLEVDTGDYVRHNLEVAIPAATYADDGSIVVAVKRLNGQSGAMVNEIALEIESSNVNSTCPVRPTPFRMNVYGQVTVNDAPAPVGTQVLAYNAAGAVVGCFTVSTGGQYGAMTIFGADPSANPPIPGMTAGQLVLFRVNGVPAVAAPQAVWQENGLAQVDLTAGGVSDQSILLPIGEGAPRWHLISTYVEPVLPSLRQALGSITGRYDRVLGDGVLHDITLDDVYNSLREIHAGPAYYLRTTDPATIYLLMQGVPVAGDTPLALKQGWNWVGYLPADAQATRAALASIDGLYQRVLSLDKIFIPAIPDSFSTLKELKPGDGYLIYMNEAATLVYPAPAQSGALSEPQTPATCGGVQPTPAATLVYGYLTVNGEPAPLGVRVEVLTPGGDVAGCFEVTTAGQYGVMHVYGADDTAVPPIPGFRDGETLRFRVAGVETAPAAAITWQDDKAPHQADLSVDGVEFDFDVYMPLIVRPAEMDATQAHADDVSVQAETPPVERVGEQYLPYVQR